MHTGTLLAAHVQLPFSILEGQASDKKAKKSLVRPGRGSNPRPPDCEANALTTRSSCRYGFKSAGVNFSPWTKTSTQ